MCIFYTSKFNSTEYYDINNATSYFNHLNTVCKIIDNGAKKIIYHKDIFHEINTPNIFDLEYMRKGKYGQEKNKISINLNTIQKYIIKNEIVIPHGGHYRRDTNQYDNLYMNLQFNELEGISINNNDVYITLYIDYKSLLVGDEYYYYHINGNLYKFTIPENNGIKKILINNAGLNSNNQIGHLYISPLPLLVKEDSTNIEILKTLKRG